MSGFFDSLERELVTAAGRPARRRRGSHLTGVMVAVAALAAAMLLPLVVLVGGDSDRDRSASGGAPAVGTVIRAGTGTPPREADSTIVATGRAPVAGPWQLEVYRGRGVRDPKTGAIYEPSGLSCVRIVLRPAPSRPGASGYCGSQLPGFTRGQTGLPARHPKEVLVFGRVPERAARVVVTSGRTRLVIRPEEGPASVRGDFYVIAVKPPLAHGRINWVGPDGRPGSRGMGLLPPLGR